MPRPTIYDQPMTPAERKRRSRDLQLAVPHELLAELLEKIQQADHEDAKRIEWQMHGAGLLAYRLGMLTEDEWTHYDDQASAAVRGRRQ